jgi:hypothetical protein
MKPKVCVVTTPNRDFNVLFDYLESLNPNGEKKKTYRRDGVPYRMRHHDHRFEWTRQEFRTWALAAAKEYGYDVQFTGVGGAGRGMSIEGGNNVDDILKAAASTYKPLGPLSSGASAWDRLKGIVCEVDDDEEGTSDIRKAFGDCSQMAIFVIKPEMDGKQELNALSQSIQGDGLKLIHYHEYPHAKDEEFPPPLRMVLSLLMKPGRLMHLLPSLIREEWAKSDKEVLKDYLHWREYGDAFWPSDGAWDQKRWGDLDDKREREHLFARLAGRPWEIKCVEVVVNAERLWEESYQLQRACHFKYDLFLKTISQIKATEESGLLKWGWFLC